MAADLRESLQSMGYAVPAVASSGEEALEAVRTHTPRVVLMDVRMPGSMDGVAAPPRSSSPFQAAGPPG